MTETNTQKIIRLAIVAAVYVVLTIAFSFMSYGNIQFRIAEILILLCFFRKDYIIAVSLGCFIANLFSPLGIIDAVFGTLATVTSGLLVSFCKNITVAGIYPVVLNAIIVGLELYFILELPFFINALSVALGEAVVLLVGILVFKKLQTNEAFQEMIKANQNVRVWLYDINCN